MNTDEFHAPHWGVEIGDIFHSSWGYDQTNVDFYEVVKLTPKGVKLHRIGTRTVDDNGGPVTHVIPNPGCRLYEPFTRFLRGYTGRNGDTPTVYCNMTSYSIASLWDGKPKYQTGHGWGH